MRERGVEGAGGKGGGDRKMVQFRITKHHAMASISGLRGLKNEPISDHESPRYGVDFGAHFEGDGGGRLGLKIEAPEELG